MFVLLHAVDLALQRVGDEGVHAHTARSCDHLSCVGELFRSERAPFRDLQKDERVPAPSASPVDAIAPLIELERVRLLSLLADLDEEDWQRPTPCPDWTVLGLACHLLGNDLGLLARRRDHYMGTPPPDGLSESEFIDWLDELQIEWVRAARRLSPPLVVEMLEWTGPRLFAVLGEEDLSERAAPVSWAGPEPAPRWLDQLRELSEYWIHRQQLLEALGRPVDLDPTLLRPILLGLRWALPYRLSRVELTSGAIQISIGDPINGRWTVVPGDRGWNFSEVEPNEVIARAALTADEAWRLLTNNLRRSPSSLDITGNDDAVAALLTTRAIIGQPK
jgi:uncharacterized protein (TIGR03083 family)